METIRHGTCVLTTFHGGLLPGRHKNQEAEARFISHCVPGLPCTQAAEGTQATPRATKVSAEDPEQKRVRQCSIPRSSTRTSSLHAGTSESGYVTCRTEWSSSPT